jgi:hypothetical protein
MAKGLTPAARKGLLGKAHIGRKQLGMDEETWRGMLEERYNVGSSGDLSDRQLVLLVDHLAGLGAEFTSKARPRNKPGYRAGAASRRSDFYEIPPGPNARTKRYIAALWRELGYDMLSLDTRVKREFGVEAFRWLEDEDALSRLVMDLRRRAAAKARKDNATPAQESARP